MGRIRTKLKEWLDSRGLTTYKLAEEIERRNISLTKGAVYNIVSGRTNPSLDSLAKILDVLNWMVDDQVDVCDIIEYEPD